MGARVRAARRLIQTKAMPNSGCSRSGPAELPHHHHLLTTSTHWTLNSCRSASGDMFDTQSATCTE